MKASSKKKLKKAAENAAGGIAAGLFVAYAGWFLAGMVAIGAVTSIVENASDKDFAKGFLSGGLDALIPESVERWVVDRFRG